MITITNKINMKINFSLLVFEKYFSIGVNGEVEADFGEVDDVTVDGVVDDVPVDAVPVDGVVDDVPVDAVPVDGVAAPVQFCA